MLFENSVDVIIRSFMKGATVDCATIPPGTAANYKDQLARVIQRLLPGPYVRNIYVVINGDPSSPLSEEAVGINSFTADFIRYHSVEAEDRKRVIPVICKNWGLNAGSATAINQAIRRIKKQETRPRWALVLSKEILMDNTTLLACWKRSRPVTFIIW